MKLISFLVTVYNLEEWLLKRCIDSLFEQGLSYDQFEIVVVDDGSQHSPEQLIATYPSEVVRFHRQPNGGPGAARNSALHLAKGEYMMFVDGDDYLFQKAVAPLTRALTDNCPDILTFSFRHCHKEQIETINFKEINFEHYESGADYMLTHHLVGSNWLYLFRRALVTDNKLRYMEHILHEDEDFITRLFFFAGKVMVTQHPVYAYYFREDSIVHHPAYRQVVRRLNDFLFVMEQLLDFAGLQKDKTTEKQLKALRRKIDFLGVDFLLKTFRTEDPELFLSNALPRLKRMGLYPLPTRSDEGVRYQLFRYLSNWATGRSLLRIADRYRSKKF